jgi:murein DD-endopeptidase MepM/ murein hydrolase activator NlpD
MSESAALNMSRIAARIAVASVLGGWLAGCSSDATRLSDFSNPFSVSANDEAPPVPRANLAMNEPGQPNANYAAAPHPSPIAVAALPAPAPMTTGAIPRPTTTQPITGFGDGWRAEGGSPVVVAEGETLDIVSRRYGVPPSALLKVNGFTSPSQVHGGVRLIVPVYDASAKTAAPVARHEAPAPKVVEKIEKNEKNKPSDKGAKLSDRKTKLHDKAVDAKADTQPSKPKDKTKPTASAAPAVSPKPAVVGKADIAAQPTAPVKKKPVDSAPTGSVNPQEATAAAPLTGAQADAAGVSPEFRWPARGRIIQGFKSGGNDGINIAVPEGTSVKAAESGVVAYAGSELKGYGNLVLIRHPNGFVSAYANNGELEVKRGESVKRGQTIAKSGQSGNVSSPQLHFELRKGSTPVDPTSFLAGL